MITIYPHTDHYVFSFIYIFMYKKTAKSNKKLKKFLLNAVLDIEKWDYQNPDSLIFLLSLQINTR